MAALHALRPAVGGIARNPILLLVTALYGLAQVPNLLVPPTRPVLSAVVSLVTFGALILALAYFVLLAINFVFGFVAFVGALIAVVGGAATAPADVPALGVDPALLAGLAVVGGGFLLAYLLVTFVVQFYAHAVVLDDAELVDGFRRSVGLVRSNVASVLGYTLVLLVGSVVLGTLAAAASVVLSPQTAGTAASPFADLVPFDLTLPVLVVAGVGYLLLTSAF